MGVTSPLKGPTRSRSFTTKLLPYVLYASFSIALCRFYFHFFPFLVSNRIILTSSSSSSPSPSPPSLSFFREEETAYETPCNYTNGRWVHDKMGPLYNGTTCGTIKDGQNCISHGRADLGYLYWRWQPNQCQLPRFDPNTFFNLVSNKHIAFVGDSMARNQWESLLCMLATASNPNPIYTNGEDNKFRTWHFDSHNVTVSVYWSPFLVRGVEKSKDGPDHNELYVDVVDDRWGSDLDHLDTVVLSVGHWFLHPAVYYEGGSVLGCHYCPGLNHTEIGFYGVMRKAIKTALETIIERKMGSGCGIDVFLTSFSPSHFEGEWDKAGACPKTEPYKEGEKMVEGMDADMRSIAVEEIEAAKVNAKQFGRLRLEILDVTKLSLMRRDGHPGPYMYRFPFADGVREHVQNDCVHWCLPGPIDTWNQIMLHVIRRWRGGE
ncbi:Protein ALTERED XYLOGLUCAN 4 [Hibiscus syriacus]|uniref:Protein ALTERED XYLOGLUCAN 4 n=1 Tax=Hibiscus syriacus TaxID=106335 RepID=A0A6A3C0S4_HIBSY|nr:protein ALTERED XYLOGLUCAN 4-like [Hibiscus syriacus]KAE8722665.1 Protein ALTERED XYLOGLUCAN 4 [Hibiscus syriacus]